VNTGTALCLRQATFPTSTGTITQAIDAVRIEAHQTFADGLRVAVEVGGNGGRTQACPTPHNDLGPTNPITRRMAACGECVDHACFARILGWARNEELGHTTLLRR
jgi:hypothetical protein